MTAAAAPGAARGRAREGASRRKKLEDELGGKSSRYEVVLEEPSDVEQAWAFVICKRPQAVKLEALAFRGKEEGSEPLRSEPSCKLYAADGLTCSSCDGQQRPGRTR